MERDHGRVVEVCRELTDASGHAFELGGRLHREDLRLPDTGVHADLPVGQVWRFGVCLALLGRRHDDDGRGDAERERDRGERRPGAGLVAGEVSQRQAHRDRRVPGRPGEEADRQRTQEQRAEDRRQDPGDDERLAGSVGEHEAADSRRDQQRGDDGRVVCGLRPGRSRREGEHDGDAGHRSPRPPGGGGRPEDGDEDDHRQQRPGQAEPVDAMVDRGLERRGDREPERETRDRSDQRADRADDRAVGQQHESKVLLGRADRSEHAELAEPSLRDHGEARGGDQRGQQQEDGGHREHRQRVGRPVALPSLGPRECGPLAGVRPVKASTDARCRRRPAP